MCREFILASRKNVSVSPMRDDAPISGSPRDPVPAGTTVPAGKVADVAHVRFLTTADVAELLVLEHQKWTAEQAAPREELVRRIRTHPRFCVGAFHARTGQALASLFVKPTSVAEIRAARTWAECATVAPASGERPAQALFGISLTSIEPQALDALLEFFWPIAVESGAREVYLGSPVPGLRAWRRRNPHAAVEDYVRARHKDRPVDPQLHYYHTKGFTHIEAVRPGYFPHHRSLDYGVVLRAPIPPPAGDAGCHPAGRRA